MPHAKTIKLLLCDTIHSKCLYLPCLPKAECVEAPVF